MIIKNKHQFKQIDVMQNCDRWEIKIHDHGFIALVDVMPRLVIEGTTADSAIVQAARVSYGAGTKKISEDEGLVRYLLRHKHTTPFEMTEFKFHMSMPIFIARQFIRHRTVNVNEYSARYSVLPDKFYRPTKEYIQSQSTNNKQGREGMLEDISANEFLEYLNKAESLYGDYSKLIEKGVAREISRIGLPLSIYTQWYWKCDLHNIFHFLGLRMDKHAQQEIRDYANAMFEMVKEICPIASQAFLDYHPNMNGMSLTSLEIEAIKNKEEIKTENKREREEWEQKKQRLGLV